MPRKWSTDKEIAKKQMSVQDRLDEIAREEEKGWKSRDDTCYGPAKEASSKTRCVGTGPRCSVAGEVWISAAA